MTGDSTSINNSSQCSANGYGDYVNLPAADLVPGSTYSLSVSTDYSSPTSEQVRAWIDYNADGNFAANELIAQTDWGGLPGGTGVFSFSVPTDVTHGNYRMHARLAWDTSAASFDACANMTWGEAEDYTVLIGTLDACQGTPTAGTIDSDFSVFAGKAFNISVYGSSDPADGLVRIWQSSISGENNWTDIAGATFMFYTVSESIEVAMDYRHQITCINSSEIDVLGVVTVILNPVTECYCEPEVTTTSAYDYVSLVSSDLAELNINYSASSHDANYIDDTTMILEAYAGQEFNFNTAYVGGKQTMGIWVDLNKDGIFGGNDNPEKQFVLINGISLQSFAIIFPNSIDLGEYRLRICGAYDYYGDIVADGDDFSCYAQSYGTTVDFTLKIIEETVSVNDYNMLAETRLYPNPLNNGIFYIHAPKLNGEQVELNITDMAGRQIFNNTLSINNNKVTVSVNDTWTSGVYFVTLKHEGEAHTFRLVKH